MAQAYGATRPTQDFDCLVRRDKENFERLSAAMRLGARLRVGALSDDEARALPVQVDGRMLAASKLLTWRTDAGDFYVLTNLPAGTGSGSVMRTWRPGPTWCMALVHHPRRELGRHHRLQGGANRQKDHSACRSCTRSRPAEYGSLVPIHPERAGLARVQPPPRERPRLVQAPATRRATVANRVERGPTHSTETDIAVIP